VVVTPGSAWDESAVSGSAMLDAVPSAKVKTSLRMGQHAKSATCQSVSIAATTWKSGMCREDSYIEECDTCW